MVKRAEKLINIVMIAGFIIFIVVSIIYGIPFGKSVFGNFNQFALDMIKIVPCAFLLIGLFEVWIKKETVEKHLGEDSGLMRYIWAILLAGTTVGGLYVAFPVAYTLYKKGAEPSMIFTYIGASGIFRIPMTVFEISFLGIKFTVIRLIISLPLTVLFSILLGRYMKRKGISVKHGHIPDNALTTGFDKDI